MRKWSSLKHIKTVWWQCESINWWHQLISHMAMDKEIDHLFAVEGWSRLQTMKINKHQRPSPNLLIRNIVQSKRMSAAIWVATALSERSSLLWLNYIRLQTKWNKWKDDFYELTQWFPMKLNGYWRKVAGPNQREYLLSHK